MIRSTDVIFLLGAGASAEADIPASASMIEQIESLLLEDEKWRPFKPLYDHVRSAIHFAAGIRGEHRSFPYNIEVLVNTLYELERNELHPLYPFIASWNSRIVYLAGDGFSEIAALRKRILEQLKMWTCPEDRSKARYFRGLIQLQRDLNFPLHIFSLNYDLCVEGLRQEQGFHVETGFEDVGPNHLWDWERFEHSDTLPVEPPHIFLYKLHGSIDWKRDSTKNVYSVEQVGNVDSELMEVIFGRDFKLEAADPYLFYAYQFRRFTLAANLIVVLGYGFGDSHINKMLSQALRDSAERRLLVVARCTSEEKCKDRQRSISEALDVDVKQIVVEKGTVKTFLEFDRLAERLRDSIAKPADSPF